MFNITLNETQLKDLKSFLERCELRGVEAARFLSVAYAINQASPVQAEDKKIDFQVEEK
jgi:hypothetical protein